MYVGDISTKQLTSIALMILFMSISIFFLGYRYAYNKAINYANEQIEEKIKEFKVSYGIVSGNPDIFSGNIEIPNLGGPNEE